ncbi:hypothetical protein A2U01_0069566 [Trifolium medium]|uniref:Uncharacterized protein n=1 Tax=Trifolium medium TaxID=97028 RepID=A0A392SHE3_9FABA|nr:hypothetical protein [Trifolium medium]
MLPILWQGCPCNLKTGGPRLPLKFLSNFIPEVVAALEEDLLGVVIELSHDCSIIGKLEM